MDFSQAPIIIGATGGSGTREVAQICQMVGYYMGSEVSPALDAMAFIPFYSTWVDKSLTGQAAQLSQDQHAKMYTDFMDSIKRHRRNIPNENAPWAWKNDRSMYLIPFFNALYPQMKFIHVVRDGRDVAFMKDPQQLLRHTRSFFDEQYKSLLQPLRLMLVWEATNITMASFAEMNMPGHYLRIRYEDLCENPYGIIKRLLRFIGAQNIDPARLTSFVKPPQSIGRWHVFPVELVQQLESLGREAMMKFGYL